MKIFLPVLLSGFVMFSCNDNRDDKKIVLHEDGINKVKITDTMLINASTCRGCAYENSTDFDVVDSAKIITLFAVKTIDDRNNNSDGGNIAKEIILVAADTGTTTIKLVKSYKDSAAINSSNFTVYKIRVSK